MPEPVDPEIFKAYDIRGIYGENLNDEIAQDVGRALVKILQPQTIIVGRDGRVSSPSLSRNLIEAMTGLGVDVIDIGQVSTDMYYFACAAKKLPGVMVTASHNPKQYNGFKMVKQIPYLLSGDEGIQDIRKIIEAGDFPEKAAKAGEVERWDVMADFVKTMLGLVDTEKIKPMKIVCDTANGMVGPMLRELYKNIPQIQMSEMYFEPDGTFPNHGGDPLQEENRREIMEKVPSENADLGFMFDPDGDRFFCIDSKGRFVPGDFMTAILSQYFLAKHPGATIVYDIRASKAVPDTIAKAGGKPLYNRVGHAYIKKRMKDENAVFGGEVTGHYYFADFHYCDSGVAPMLYLLDYLSTSEKTLDQILDEMENTYFLSGEINTENVDTTKVLAAIKAKYGPSADEQLEVDGISMEMGDWRFNVRASNTEPLVRLNIEATNKRLMEEKRDELLKLIRQ